VHWLRGGKKSIERSDGILIIPKPRTVQRRLVLLSNPQDIQAYIPKDQLLQDFGGDDDFDFREGL
jgi:hypothetical protein